MVDEAYLYNVNRKYGTTKVSLVYSLKLINFLVSVITTNECSVGAASYGVCL